MNSSAPHIALMLPGGGARGAYQVGVIQAILEMMPEGFHFPIINGTSAGAINAVVMATHAKNQRHGVARLHHFWTTIHCADVYRTDARQIFKTMARVLGALFFGRLGVRPPRSLLDNSPLAALLSRELKLHQLQPAIDEGVLKGLSITASSYDTAIAKCFYQAHDEVIPWHRTRRVGLKEDITVDHIMASTALPFLFPARLIGNEHYGDGGLRMTAPLSPAIHLGAERILVIGSDLLTELENWHRAEELINGSRFVVVPRVSLVYVQLSSSNVVSGMLPVSSRDPVSHQRRRSGDSITQRGRG